MFTNARFAYGVNRVLARLRGRECSPPLESPELDRLKLDNLCAAQAVFDRLGLPVFLFAGTLLGWFRDKALIPHDPDVDFGLLAEEFEAWLEKNSGLVQLIETMARSGFRLERILGDCDRMAHVGFEMSFLRKGSAVDLFILVPDADRIGWRWNSVWFKQGWKRWKRHMRRQFHPWQGLEEIEFLGCTFRIPANTEAYILNHYGPGWRTPVKTWDYLHSPSNISSES